MRTIELDERQRKEVLNALAEIHDADGSFDIDIELDETITVKAKGWIETDGYREDDYFSGTGAYIETRRNASIELTAQVYDEESDNVEECAVTREFEQEAYNYLNAA